MSDPTPGVEVTSPKSLSNASQNVSSNLGDGANTATQVVEHHQLGRQLDRPKSPASPRALHPPQTYSENTKPGARETNLEPPLRSPALPTEKPSVNVSAEEKSSEPVLKQEMHWVSRKVMIGCLLIAVAWVLGHHLWYNSRVNQVVGGTFEQLMTRL
jgi:hypothetical protein